MKLEELETKWKEDHDWKNSAQTRLVKLEDKEVDHGDRISTLENQMIEKVSWRQFTLILSILMSVVVGMFYLVWSEVKDTNQNVYQTSQTVSRLEGILSNAQIE